MKRTSLAVAALFAGASVAPALAQNQPSGTTNQAPSAQARQVQGQQQQAQRSGADMKFITQRDANTWRASDLIGMDVYGSNNEDIGEVGDVLLNRNGQVIGVVLDVGGFLGLGETHVAVPMNALQFQDNPGQTASAANRGTGTGTAAGSGSTSGSGAANTNDRGTSGNTAARTGNMAGDKGPDRIVLIITKEQLMSAPKFKDDGAQRPSANTGASGTANTGTTGNVPNTQKQR